MKFLLIALNAKYIHSNPAVYGLRAYAAAQKNIEHAELEIAEYTINQESDEILRDLYGKRPDVAAFSCYIWNIAKIEEIACELKKVLPQTEIWFGGPEVSFDAKERLERCPWLTGIMRGEGEATVYELMKAYAKRTSADVLETGNAKKSVLAETGTQKFGEPEMRSLETVLGITYRNVCSGVWNFTNNDRPAKCCMDGHCTETESIRENPERPPLDFATLPFPYADLKDFENRIIYYESSRGCPYSCSYCLSSIEKRVRFRNLDLVKKELAFFLENRVPQVKFVDRTFNCNKAHAMEIWQYLKEYDNGVTNFHFEIAADLMDEEELELLASLRPGQVQLEIGVQTTNPQTLAAIRRKTDFEMLKSVTERILKGGNIHQHLDLIAGLPYEDYGSFGRSFDDVYRLRPDQLQLGFLKVLKGAAMDAEAVEYGIVYHETPPYEVLYTKWLTFADVVRLKQIEDVLEVYYNSGQFALAMRFLEHRFASPFVMYEALAAYYENNGLFGKKYARMERFLHLLEFGKQCLSKNGICAEKTHGSEANVKNGEIQMSERNVEAGSEPEYLTAWQEILVYDYCKRERPKSHLPFAKPQEAYREAMKQYYDTHEKTLRTHTYLHHFAFSPEKTARTGAPVREDALRLFDYEERRKQ